MPKLEYELTVYPFHIDAMGHVNNTIYAEWMEVGRVHLLDAVEMSIAQIMRRGLDPFW